MQLGPRRWLAAQLGSLGPGGPRGRGLPAHAPAAARGAGGQTCPALPERDALAAALTLSGRQDRCCSQSTRSPRLLSQLLLFYYYFIYASKDMLSLTRPIFHSHLFPEVKGIASTGVSVSDKRTSMSSGRKSYLKQTSS